MRLWWSFLALLASCEGCGSAAPVPPPPPPPSAHATDPPAEPTTDPPGEEGAADPAPAPGGDAPATPEPDVADDAPSPAHGPEGPEVADPEPLAARAELADLDARACHRMLRRAHVRFRAVDRERAPDVEVPILLSGPVGGVEVRYRGRRERNSILDCRLALALAGWAPTLRSAGVERIEHMSAYRPGSRVRSTGRPSGHASGTAIDVSHFVRPGGQTLEVERDWSDKTIGADPCGDREDEPEAERLLRTLVCTAIDADLFQVVVTPNGNARHHNHVHLEIRPDVDWSHVR